MKYKLLQKMKIGARQIKSDSSNQNGRSMIEMLGVLAIVGVLSAGGLAGYSKMLSRYKISQSIDQINAISAKLSSVGAETSSFAGMNNKAAIKFGAIPTEAILDAKAGTLVNPFGGEIRITPGSEDLSYLIIYTKLSKDACIAMATTEWGGNNSTFIRIGAFATEAYLGQGILFSAMNSNSDAVTNSSSAVYPASKTPIPPAVAANGCSCRNSICVLALRFN